MAAKKKKKAGAPAKAGVTKKKKAAKPAKARKAPAKKSKKAVKKSAKKTKAKKAGATKKKTVKAAAKKTPTKKKTVKKKQAVGEGDYAATRKFDSDQTAFVAKNKANIPNLGKDAEKALDGPEGDSLRDAEATAAGRSRDNF